MPWEDEDKCTGACAGAMCLDSESRCHTNTGSSSREVRIRQFPLQSILVGEPSPKKGSKGTTGGQNTITNFVQEWIDFRHACPVVALVLEAAKVVRREHKPPLPPFLQVFGLLHQGAFEKNVVLVDDDLLRHSKKGQETREDWGGVPL